jgi:hypothetical protein
MDGSSFNPILYTSIEANNNSITEIKTLSFNGEYDNSSKTTDFTVDFIEGQNQTVIV